MSRRTRYEVQASIYIDRYVLSTRGGISRFHYSDSAKCDLAKLTRTAHKGPLYSLLSTEYGVHTGDRFPMARGLSSH
jgi:hypothetical protein